MAPGYDLTGTEPAEQWTQPPAGRVLCFAPHPDDEVIGPGGALAMHRRQGDPVRVIVASDGLAGDPDGHFADQDYAALRRAESRAGLAVLGIADCEFWGHPDNHVLSPADLDGAVAQVRAELRAFSPELVYLPWSGESHGDHRALHQVVSRGLEAEGFAGTALGYEVWTPMEPQLLLDIAPVEAIKREAIRAYRSQLRYVDYEYAIFGLHAYRSLQSGTGRGYAEAYQRVGGER